MARHLKNPKRILITGASSGIGAALAEAYAGPGVSLYLGGRDGPRLNTEIYRLGRVVNVDAIRSAFRGTVIMPGW